jgi:predicted transcriptional regulator
MQLREYLASENLTASAFARQVGVTHSTVLRWIEGMPPKRDAVIRITEATRGKVTALDLMQEPAA